MANRSDRELAKSSECLSHNASIAEWNPARGYHQGQWSSDRIERPDTRLHPTNAKHQIVTRNAGAIHTKRSPFRCPRGGLAPFLDAHENLSGARERTLLTLGGERSALTA